MRVEAVDRFALVRRWAVSGGPGPSAEGSQPGKRYARSTPAGGRPALYGRNVTNSKNTRESGRGILTTTQPGHDFPASPWPTPYRIQHTVYGGLA